MHMRREEKDMEREEHTVEAKFACPNDGERDIVLVCKGDMCNKSKVGNNNMVKWKL
jgi:hypothetical protein